ncbi:MAG: UDP-2,3-diacylglucosamine diphosphatase [bacterium]|nr:UDP-2,3-diacylglucosamine diphosphatase [bacterium]
MDKPKNLAEIWIPEDKKIFFFSDAHLGNQPYHLEKSREEKLISFIQKISKETEYVFILGDLFDFWFEYNKSIYKRYIRILSELMAFTDNNINVNYLVGNHDFWMKDLFKKFFHFNLHFNPVILNYGKDKVFIAHGDGLNPKDRGYLFVKRIFRSDLTVKLFSSLHPDLAWAIAHNFSKTSRKYTEQYSSSEIEELKKFSKNKIENEHFNKVILGHTHNPEITSFKNGEYINSGDWINHFSYIEVCGNKWELKYYSKTEK